MVSGVMASCNIKQVSVFFVSISFLFPVKIVDHFTGVDSVSCLQVDVRLTVTLF